MGNEKYEIFVRHENEVVATGMDLKTATILIRALFEEYYNEHHLTIGIRKMEKEND